MAQESPRGTRAASSYSRRRAGNACLVCRSRKTKCDNQRPVCGFCASTGGECQYVDSDPSQFDRASLAILQRLGELESSLVNHIDDAFKQHELTTADLARPVGRFVDEAPTRHHFGSHDGRSTAGWTPGSLNSPGGQKAFAHSRGLQRDGDLADILEDRPPSSKVLLQASEMFADSVLKWPIFSQAAPHLERELHVPIMEFWTRSDGNIGRTPSQTGNKGATLLNLDSNVVNELVENFLTNNHVKNPVLDVESLRADAEEFAEIGPQWDEKSCLILIVCAVGSLSSPLDQETEPGPSKYSDRLSMAEAYFQASQRRIGMLYHHNSLMIAQCSFLTAVYLMSTMQILAAWKCFVQAGTQCLAWLTSQGRMKGTASADLATSLQREHGTHRDHSAATSQAEECLYWSCLKSELELRFELGLPGSGLNELDYPHLFPSPPVNNQNGNPLSYYESLAVQCSYDEFSTSTSDRRNLELGWFFYLAEIALKRIIHNVVSWLYKSENTNSHSDHKSRDNYLEVGVAEFETQIQEWYNTLPPPMRFPAQTDQTTGDILRFILRGHMLDIREVVRFPAIHAILASPSMFSADNPSLTCVRLARELLENAVERIKANREGWYHRHQGTWLMMRSCSRSALHLLGMALKCQQAAAVMSINRKDLETKVLPPRWKEAVEQVAELLDYWADESSDMKRLSHVLKELMHSFESFGG